MAAENFYAVQSAPTGCSTGWIGCSQPKKVAAPKLDRVLAWQAAGDVVAMVGDGVNDAPVLAGGATAAAVSSTDIVSLSDDVAAVVTARDATVRTMRILRQNLAWAVGYNLAAIPAAAMGLVPPWLAAIGMSLSSLIVIGNAARLRYRPEREARCETPANPVLDAGAGRI